MRRLWSALGAVAWFSSSLTAAALTQPNGAVIPSPPGCNAGKPTGLAATFACVCDAAGACNIGAPCSGPGACPDGKNATCETTLFHSFNDNTCIPSNLTGLDPSKDAATTPETFRPSCALTFTVVSRGTAMFGDVFGWYNVTPGKAPDRADLHPMLGCGDAAGKAVVLDVTKDPAYKGGDIGFFLLTPESRTAHGSCAGGDCCASLARYDGGVGYLYFTERKYNADVTGPSPFIHLLVLDSKMASRKFYFAWEDIFGGSNNDFTDLVTSVEGVECSGGGLTCSTGQKGQCGEGLTACKAGKLECTGVFAGKAEACNGLDDDCDGQVDDGATCAAPSEVCFQGRCVPKCGVGEFKCGAGSQCDNGTGLCVDPSCVGVSCPADKVCRKGACVAPCEGVTCPKGQRCVGDACVDLCKGVACTAGQVCKEGVCVAGCASCGGIGCAAPTSCDAASGACLDKSCAAPCPAGTVCESGQCKNRCAGVVCPGAQVCKDGECKLPGASPAGGGGLGPGATGPGGGGATPDDDYGARSGAGCGCDTSSASASTGALAVALAAGALALCRRRRRGRSPAPPG
ncbi:MAG: DUF4114 domain-containing protein [Myxococcales bacterium]|nr:DUF4114 domain-containing protein [Myxococcales bacterium]